ncbi:MAG: S41 family peptidase [Candidatus Moranbacteria bacterium]|nr:S41 family peptidase [Candidatus Moranbacteria bacterium]
MNHAPIDNENSTDEKAVSQEKINEEKGKKLLVSYLKYSLTIILLVGSFWFGFQAGKNSEIENSGLNAVSLENSVVIDPETKANREVDFALFWEVWGILKEKYVDAGELDAQKLLYGSINGMLSATEDPYTMFFDPEQNKQFNEEIDGKFEGIGAEIGMKKGILTVIAPLEGSPAEKSGLRPGDKILKIDGESTAEMNINESVKLMRGERGTEVKLTIFRNNGDDSTEEISIIRDTINVKSVTVEMKDNKIAYFKITRFGDDTSRDFFKEALKLPSDTKGILLDLRSNPGGYLYAAVEMASKFLPKDQVVVIEEDGEGKQSKLYTEGGDILKGIPVVILINEGSASASEILAGALRENADNVTLVGKQSFGKGSVQELIDLPSESAVKITIAKWLTPKGNQINKVGITPDVEVDFTNEDYQNDRDPQLDKALEILRAK